MHNERETPSMRHPNRPRPDPAASNRPAPRLARIAAACLLAWLPAAMASTPPSEDLTLLPLEQLMELEITTASKYAQRAAEAPSAVTVVTRDEIRAYGWRTLGDILNSMRGVYTSYDRNYTYLGVRGFGRPGDYNTRVLLMLDGYRLNDNLYDGGLIGTEGILDVELIDRVEFVPGPGSAIYGNNAFFGVVNVITRSGKDLGGFEVAGAVGSDHARSGRVAYGRSHDSGLDLLLSASAYETDGRTQYYPEFDDPATNNGRAVDLDHDRYQRFYAKLGYGGFLLSLAHSDRTKGYPTAPYGTDFNAPDAETTDRQTLLNLQYDTELGSHNSLTARLFYGEYEYQGDYTYAGVVDRDDDEGRWWGTELRLLNTAWRGHKLMAGLEYQQDLRQDLAYFIGGVPDPNMGVPPEDDRWGVFVQDEIALSERLSLHAGLRHDQPAEGDSKLNPRLALIYQHDPDTTLKALYGTAFRAPNAYERYYNPTGIYALNPDLKAEEIETYELVLERRLDRRTRVMASVFHYEIEDLINLTTLPGGLLSFENLSRAEADGLELEAERRWDDGGQLKLSYSWQQVTDDDGRRLDNSPRHLAKLHYARPLLDNRLRLGLEGQYMSSRITPQGGEVGSHAVFNLTLTAPRLAKDLELSASVYNLLDRGYADPGSDEHVQDQLARDGRTYRVQLTYRF